MLCGGGSDQRLWSVDLLTESCFSRGVTWQADKDRTKPAQSAHRPNEIVKLSFRCPDYVVDY